MTRTKPTYHLLHFAFLVLHRPLAGLWPPWFRIWLSTVWHTEIQLLGGQIAQCSVNMLISGMAEHPQEPVDSHFSQNCPCQACVPPACPCGWLHWPTVSSTDRGPEPIHHHSWFLAFSRAWPMNLQSFFHSLRCWRTQGRCSLCVCILYGDRFEKTGAYTGT